MIASLMNHAWWCAAAASGCRFRRALADPEATQARLLRALVCANADTAFGREHGFVEIDSLEEFSRRVPIRRYDELSPWIDRVVAGEPRVLTAERVQRLVPSSGSTSARKLIPFTATLRRQFNAAIGPWIDGLFRATPDLARGSAYWSITPAVKRESNGPVPIGFDDDSAYLGGVLGSLVGSVMAVPAAAARIERMDAFRYATLLSLLRRSDLRLISVWHPSFLTLLLDQLPLHWGALLDDVESGACSVPGLDPGLRSGFFSRPDRVRARHLQACGPHAWPECWPALGMISCWADGAARGPARQLHDRCPSIRLQPKGLLATEGVVSFPLGEHHPIALRSHFFEFLDDAGRVFPAHQLQVGACYEVLLTTGGGLYRYRLGDTIQVDGFLSRTPSIRLVGRADGVSDLVGEKLSEAFVGNVLEQWCDRFGIAPSFAMLAPTTDDPLVHYVLYVDHTRRLNDDAELALDAMLRKNPHYDWARRLDQLRAVRLFPVSSNAFDQYSAELVSRGMRFGDIKPVRLNATSSWSKVFVRHPPADSKASIASSTSDE